MLEFNVVAEVDCVTFKSSALIVVVADVNVVVCEFTRAVVEFRPATELVGCTVSPVVDDTGIMTLESASLVELVAEETNSALIELVLLAVLVESRLLVSVKVELPESPRLVCVVVNSCAGRLGIEGSVTTANRSSSISPDLDRFNLWHLRVPGSK